MADRRFSLLTLQIGIGSVVTLCLALTAGSVYAGYLQRDAERLLIEALQARGQVGMSAVHSRLQATWETANKLAKVIDLANLDESRRSINTPLPDRKSLAMAWRCGSRGPHCGGLRRHIRGGTRFSGDLVPSWPDRADRRTDRHRSFPACHGAQAATRSARCFCRRRCAVPVQT